MQIHKTGRDRLFTAAVCLGFVLVQLDVSIVNVGLEVLRQHFQAGIADLEWVMNTYSLLFASLLLGAGTLGDRFGVRNVFVCGILIFIGASLSCAFAPTIYWLDTARGIQGVGAALLVPSSLTLLRQYFSDHHARAGAIAMWAACGSFALAAGPVVGGVLIKWLGWKSIFLINVPVGLLSVFFTLRFAPISPRFQRKINIASQVLIVLALGLLTFALTESAHFGWGSRTTLSTLLVGLAALVWFILSEKKSADPVVMPSVLQNRLIVSSVIIGFLCNMVFYGAVFIFSIFFQSELKLSALQTGLAFLPMMLFTAVVNYSSSKLGRRFRLRWLSCLGSLVSLTGFALLLLIKPDWSTWALFIPMMLLGAGTSLAMPGVANLIFSQATHQEAGSASALFSCARQMGGVMGVAVFGLMISYTGDANLISGLKLIAATAMLMSVIWWVISRARLPA
ncbi:MFS transporter [Pantoea sp. At-9b]|uniref:MFS transporter n=1 Tax=Pantoea sp. (strain At-9b) TaxID=592316 RepID=UPI0001F25FA6|nr:MFS transporter [Pantoea sp. At-9b]ADU72788.1 major facilitator superfamily MFS_1 [Pantoea sp. At-9b]